MEEEGLYYLEESWFGQREEVAPGVASPKSTSGIAPSWLLVTLLAGSLLAGVTTASAQVNTQSPVSRPLSLEGALQQTVQNNPLVRVSALTIGVQQALRGTATDLGKTDLSVSLGQYNSPYFDQSLSVGQRFPAPALIRSQRRLLDARINGAEAEARVTRQELALQTKSAYYELIYLRSLRGELLRQDSLLRTIVQASQVRKRTGEGSLLEQTAAEVEARQLQMALRQNQSDELIRLRRLQTLLGAETLPRVGDSVLSVRSLDLPLIDSTALRQNPELALLLQQLELARRETDVERARLKPDFALTLTNQSLRGFYPLADGTEQYYNAAHRFTFGQVGISLPLIAKPLRARVRAAQLSQQRAEASLTARQRSLRGAYDELVQTYRKNEQTLAYFQQSALPQAALIRQTAERSYRAGEIGYVELLQNLRTVIGIQTGYLAALNEYNQTIINLEFILGSTQP